MAQLLAPYHNGMRLGQGFNSYTQQICLDNAVLPDNDENRDRVRVYYVPDSTTAQYGKHFLPKLHKDRHLDTQVEIDHEDRPKLQPWVKPQIVTYSSRFVDKLQDVTDSMNISGALSINTGTIGGKGSGNYVDSDKFKDSDINFHLQVKVVNQIHKPEEYILFNNIHNMDPSDFTSVYGDSFISGWEEGGELNAIVSMKVTDKSKIFSIKAELEANINGAVKVEVKAAVDIRKESTNKSTETTIAVNWAGGGSIKPPEEQWTIEAMTKAAAAFPDLVAMTPQRTYAILTKYSALESFQRQIRHYSILDYENASIYTNMLMEHFMEYKMMWKQLSQATIEIQRGIAKIEWSEESDEIADLANVRPIPDAQLQQKLKQEDDGGPYRTTTDKEFKIQQLTTTAELEDRLKNEIIKDIKDEVKAEMQVAERLLQKAKEEQEALKQGAEANSIANQLAIGCRKFEDASNRIRLQFPPFEASIAGLVRARKVCRSEMAKIVNEVDLITKAPHFALDQTRDDFFLEPEIYRRLLPIVRTWNDDMLPDASLADAPVILGFLPQDDSGKALPDVCVCTPATLDTHTDLATSIKSSKVRRKAKNYRMLGVAGIQPKDVLGKPRFFNDLESLDPTYRPTVFAVWVNEGIVQGIQVTYANGEKKSHGICDESKLCYCIELKSDQAKGTEIIFDIKFETAIIDVTLNEKAPELTPNVSGPPRDTNVPQNDPPPASAPADGAVGGPKIITVKEKVISSIALVTSTYEVMNTATDTPKMHPGKKPADPEKTESSESEKPKLLPEPADIDDAKIAPKSAKSMNEPVVISRPDVGRWSIRGFFGFLKGVGENTRFLSVGTVYGRDKFVPRPKYPEILPICKTYFNYPQTWRENPNETTKSPNLPATAIQKEIKLLYGYKFQFAGKCIMGDLATTSMQPKQYFNHIRQIGLGWKLKSILFGTTDGKLTGLEVNWVGSDKKPAKHGSFPTNNPKSRTWLCEMHPKLMLSGKITRAKAKADDKENWIQTVEFIQSVDENGSLPPWLLDTATMRYIGDGATHFPEDPPIIESAPSHDSAVWSLRGLYGGEADSGIVALGFIWGKDK